MKKKRKKKKQKSTEIWDNASSWSSWGSKCLFVAAYFFFFCWFIPRRREFLWEGGIWTCSARKGPGVRRVRSVLSRAFDFVWCTVRLVQEAREQPIQLGTKEILNDEVRFFVVRISPRLLVATCCAVVLAFRIPVYQSPIRSTCTEDEAWLSQTSSLVKLCLVALKAGAVRFTPLFSPSLRERFDSWTI